MNKQVISLSVLLVILATAIYFLVVQTNSQQQQNALIFPSLGASANNIESIRISSANGELLRAMATPNGWFSSTAEMAIKYPVDQAKLAQLIKELSTALLLEAKTKKSQNFAVLGLTDLSDPDSQATLVEITTSNNSYQILVGTAASSGQGSYARRAEQKQSWLLNQHINVPSDPYDWLRQPILDIDKQQVLAITRVDTHPFEIRRGGPQNELFELQNMPPKASLKYASIVDGFVDALVNLSFDRMVKPENAEWQQEPQPVEFQISLQNGDVVLMHLLKDQQMAWVKFEQLAGKEAHYWQNITYQISNFSASQLNKRLSDFIESEDEIEPPPAISLSIDEGESPSAN